MKVEIHAEPGVIEEWLTKPRTNWAAAYKDETEKELGRPIFISPVHCVPLFRLRFRFHFTLRVMPRQ